MLSSRFNYLRFVMTLSDLQEHYHNLELLEEAELLLNSLRDVKAVSYDQIGVHESNVIRQTETRALLVEKQLQTVNELQSIVDNFNREQLQPFLDNVYKTAALKLWNYLYMRYVAGYHWDEIANFFHDTTDAVKSRCARYLRSHLPK